MAPSKSKSDAMKLPSVYKQEDLTSSQKDAAEKEDKLAGELTAIGAKHSLSPRDKSFITNYTTENAFQRSKAHTVLSDTSDKSVWGKLTDAIGNAGQFGLGLTETRNKQWDLTPSLSANLSIGEFLAHNEGKLGAATLTQLHQDVENAGQDAGFGYIAKKQGIGNISVGIIYGDKTQLARDANTVQQGIETAERADSTLMKPDSKFVYNAQGKLVLNPFASGDPAYLNMLPQLVDPKDNLGAKVYLGFMGEADLKAYQGFESVYNPLVGQYNSSTNQAAFAEQSKGLQGLSDRSWAQGVKASRADQLWGGLLGAASYYSGLPGGQLTGSNFMQAAGFGGEIPSTATTSQGGTGQTGNQPQYSAKLEYDNIARAIATNKINASEVENDAEYATDAASGWRNTITRLGLGKEQGGKLVDTTEKKYLDDPTAQALSSIISSGPIQDTIAGSYYQLGLADDALRAGEANVASAFKLADDEYNLWKGMSTVDNQYAGVLEAKPSLLPKALNEEQASVTAARNMLANQGVQKWLQVARPKNYVPEEAAQLKGAAGVWRHETAIVQAEDVRDALKVAQAAKKDIAEAWSNNTKSHAGTIISTIGDVFGGLAGCVFGNCPWKAFDAGSKMHKEYDTAEHAQTRIVAALRALIKQDPDELAPLFAQSAYWRNKHLLQGVKWATEKADNASYTRGQDALKRELYGPSMRETEEEQEWGNVSLTDVP